MKKMFFNFMNLVLAKMVIWGVKFISAVEQFRVDQIGGRSLKNEAISILSRVFDDEYVGRDDIKATVVGCPTYASFQRAEELPPRHDLYISLDANTRTLNKQEDGTIE